LLLFILVWSLGFVFAVWKALGFAKLVVPREQKFELNKVQVEWNQSLYKKRKHKLLTGRCTFFGFLKNLKFHSKLIMILNPAYLWKYQGKAVFLGIPTEKEEEEGK